MNRRGCCGWGEFVGDGNKHAMTTISSLLNLGGPDLLIIVGIVLLLFGAKKLPELGRGMGWRYDGHDLFVAIGIFLLLLLTIAAGLLINPRL